MSEGVVALDITDSPSKPPSPKPDDDDPPAASSKPDPDPPTKLGKCLVCTGAVLLYTITGLISIVVVPLYFLYAGAAWLFCNIDVTDEKSPDVIDPLQGNIFQKVHQVQETAKNWAKVPNVIRSRLVIFVVTWLIVNLSVPGLRNKLVLGSALWKWTLLVAMVSCGYSLISILTGSLIFSLCSTGKFVKNKNRVYYIKGMRQSVNLVILAALVLITWVSYFRTSRGIKKTDDTDTILHVCTWSFVTLAVMAVLWMLKTALLLKWKADAVYRRFSGRILIAGLQVYFLGHICGWHLGVFQPKTEGNQENKDDDQADRDTQDDDQGEGAQLVEVAEKAGEVETSSTTHEKKDELVDQSAEKAGEVETSSTIDEGKKEKKDKENRKLEKNKAKDILFLDKEATLYDIEKMTKYFVNLFKVSSREDDGTAEVLNQCKKINENNAPDKEDDGTADVLNQSKRINGNNALDKYIEVEDLVNTFELEEKDAERLYKRLKQENSNSSKISYRNFEKSMVKAQNNCVALGHTLLDATEVVNVLNNVMTGLLFFIVFIAWLLLTDIATTKILVLIASPLLAVTFVFGDTCKKIFEGIIFSFINHPFDVGDRCIIDKIEFEVRRMSVLTTTFVVIGTKEEALYPNSALATIPIINLKGDPDPSDYVELTLNSNHTKSMLDDLHKKINKIFEKDSGNKFEKANSIVVKEIGDCVKMEIQFDHVMSINEMTHSQCLKKKRQQKSELLLQIKQLIEEINKTNKSSTVEISEETM